MTLGMCFNTAGVLILLNTQPKNWYQAPGLVNDVFTMLLVNAFIPAVIPLLDIPYLLNWRIRATVTKEKLAEFNQARDDLVAKKPGADVRAKEVKKKLRSSKKPSSPRSSQAFVAMPAL